MQRHKKVNSGALKFILLVAFYGQWLWKEIKIYVRGCEEVNSHENFWEQRRLCVLNKMFEMFDEKFLFD